MTATKLTNLINPQVMAQMVSAKLPKKIRFTPFAAIDNTLVGRAGNTITVPKYAYIGDAEDVAEGVEMGTVVLTASTTQATVKKAGKAVEITDESALSGYGDPVGESGNQLVKSIAAKVDNDCYDAISNATLTYDGTAAVIGYDAIVNTIDKFEEEGDTPAAKVIFVHPKQVTTLRKDSDFKDVNKYPLKVVMDGVIGEIGGAQAVPSRKVKLVKYEKDNTDGTITIVADTTTETTTSKHLSTIMANYVGALAVGDKVKAVSANYYACPIVMTSNTDDVDDTAALTIYMKRQASIETDRDILKKTTVISGDEHFVAVLSNESKVVVGKYKA